MTKRQISTAVAAVCLLGTVGLRAQSGTGGGFRSEASVVPRTIRYSGAIDPRIARNQEDETGKNASPAVVSLTFSLYELQEGGGPLWSESQKVQLDQRGRYGVFLGATGSEGLPLDLFASGKALWLGVQPELPGAVEQPRVVLVAVPYALKASDADTLGGKPASAYALAGSGLSVATGPPSSGANAPPSGGANTTAMLASPATGAVPLSESPTTAPTPIKSGAQLGAQPNAGGKGVNNTATGVEALFDDTTGSNNTADGYAALFTNTTGYFNTGLGEAALTYNTTGYYNTAAGGAALFFNTTGFGGTAGGAGALQYNTTGSGNTATGALALFTNTTGSSNTATGYNAGLNLSSGSSNVMMGSLAGLNFKSTESNNIDIGNQGVTGESGVIRLGTPGAQAAAYIAGITGVTPSGSPLPVVINANGQLGTGTSAAGTISGVTAGAGLTGGGTSGTVSLSVPSAGVTDAMLANAYSGVGSCASGKVISGLARNAAPTCVAAGTGTVTSVGTTPGSGILVGGTAASPSLSADPTVLATNTSVSSAVSGGVTAAETFATAAANTAQTNAMVAAEGYANGTFLPLAGGILTGLLTGTTINSTNPYQIGGTNVLSVTGVNNLFVGSAAGAGITGSGNTATGDNAGLNLTSGNSNIMIGYQAGQNFTSSESNNIDIGNQGVAAESGVTRIGSAGAQNAAFIAGINGATGLSNPVPVVIDPATGQLGTGTSGGGTIMGVTAGAGLTGGGTSGNVTLSIPTSGVTNSMLASSSLTVTAGTGLIGGGSVALGGSTTLSLAGNSCTNGYALQGLPLICTPVVGTGANTFTATQTVSSGDVSIGNGNLDLPQTTASVGVINMGGTPFVSACCSAGANNTFIGKNAGNLTTTGNFNTATGYQALRSNTSGVNNTATGGGALLSNTTGNYNTATGENAMLNNIDGYYNTASGSGALDVNTHGYYNTATGANSLLNNSTGFQNTASGQAALVVNTTGSNNTASGYKALNWNSTNSNNTASGAFALFFSTGSNNVGLGYQAGSNASLSAGLATGSGNVLLGTNAGGNFTSSESDNIDIGSGGVAADSGAIRIGSVGTQTTAYIAGISGVTVSNGATVLINSSGQLGTVLSSRRYKEDIRSMGAASDGLLRLRPVTFRYKKALDDGSKPVQYGLIAEEVAAIYPDLVARNNDGQIETVQYYKLDAMLLNEVQKLSGAHTADQAEIARLQSQVAEQAKQGQEQQAAMKQLLAQVHGIQLTLASVRAARPHSQVARTAAHHSIKPEAKQPSGQPALPLVAKARF